MPLHRSIVHLLSGGMDSVVLLYDLVHQGNLVHCVLVDYGQRHVKELELAKQHCRRLKLLYTALKIDPLRGSQLTDGSGGVIVPNRNAVLLSLAVNIAVVAKAESVTIGCNASDSEVFPDCRTEFINSFNSMLIQAWVPVEVCAPYIRRPKSDIAALSRCLGVRIDDTWSCYKGGDYPCGECLACQTRNEALK